MAKKDFSAINTGKAYSTIEQTIATATAEEPTAQLGTISKDTEPTEEQLQIARENCITQGRKGMKAMRINMAFTPEVYAYIKTMANVRGETLTEFTNAVFKKSMEDNAELYAKAKAFKESI